MLYSLVCSDRKVPVMQTKEVILEINYFKIAVFVLQIAVAVITLLMQHSYKPSFAIRMSKGVVHSDPFLINPKPATSL